MGYVSLDGSTPTHAYGGRLHYLSLFIRSSF